jgi:hypothetical protein
LLLCALERKGIRYRIVAWSDPAVDWSDAPLTVLRSAWDSHLDPPAFNSWLTRAASQSHLMNGVSLIRWNLDKQYLIELRQRGFEVVPTALIATPSHSAIAQILLDYAGHDIVAKPRIGADSFGAARLPAIVGAVQAHFERFGGHGGLLIQPFMAAVECERERSLVYIGSRFSHALYRSAFGRGPTSQSTENAHNPTSVELAYCDRLLSALPHRPCYARVDLVPIEDRAMLMELELIDPSLYFEARPAAADALAEQIELELAQAPGAPRQA